MSDRRGLWLQGFHWLPSCHSGPPRCSQETQVKTLWGRNPIPHRNSVHQEFWYVIHGRQKDTTLTWMYSISSTANGLLRYLAGSRWIEARVSGVTAIGGTRGLDSGGEAAALRGERLTASVFRASWTEKERWKNSKLRNSEGPTPSMLTTRWGKLCHGSWP